MRENTKIPPANRSTRRLYTLRGYLHRTIPFTGVVALCIIIANVVDGRVYSEMPIWVVFKHRGVRYLMRRAFKTGVKDESDCADSLATTGQLMSKALLSGLFSGLTREISMTANAVITPTWRPSRRWRALTRRHAICLCSAEVRPRIKNKHHLLLE